MYMATFEVTLDLLSERNDIDCGLEACHHWGRCIEKVGEMHIETA